MKNRVKEVINSEDIDFVDRLPRISLAHVHPDYKKRFLETTEHLDKINNAIMPDEDVKCLIFYFQTKDFKYYQVEMFYDQPSFNYQL